MEMKHALEFIDHVNEWVGKTISLLIVGVIGVMIFDVVARYAFGNPTVWGYETALFLFGAFTILGGGYTLLHEAHVKVDMLLNCLPLRVKAIIDVITSMLFFCFCGVLLWKGVQMAWASLQILEYSTQTTWEPPLYPIKLTIPIAAFLLLLQGLAKFARDLTAAIAGGKELE